MLRIDPFRSEAPLMVPSYTAVPRYLAAVAVMIAVVGGGCVGPIARGAVAMKIDDRTAHVTLGDGEVEVGDRVTLLQNECASTSGESGLAILSGHSSSTTSCRKVEVGKAEVVRVLNEHYAEIRVEPDVVFAEGTIVEKE